MERYSDRKLDELSRIVLPIELRKRLGIEIGANVALHPVCGMIVLKTKGYEEAKEWNASKVDELGRIELSVELRQKLNWQVRSDIAIYYLGDETVILKRV